MNFHKDQLFDDAPLPPSEEYRFLDVAIDEARNVKDELQGCLDILEKLSMKSDETSYLQQISPGVSWDEAEYLRYIIDSKINEERQKHDSKPPQQHHKVQEINDDSTCSVSTLSPSIINHLRRVSSDLYSDRGGAGDFETLSNSTIDDSPSSELDFLHRHKKLRFKHIKIKMAVQSALTAVQRGKAVNRFRAAKMKNYSCPHKQKKWVPKRRKISRRHSV